VQGIQQGDGRPGDRRQYAYMFKTNLDDNEYALLYGFSHWNSFGNGVNNATANSDDRSNANSVIWHKLGYRLATAAEIEQNEVIPDLQADIAINAAVSAGLDSKFGAYYGLKLNAGGTVTAIEAMADGTGVSKIKFTAATSEFTGDVIVDGTLTTDKFAANSITSAKIATGAITAGKIAAGTITANEIATNAIESDLIASNAITANKIAAGSITANKLATTTIITTNAQIDNLVVGTQNIQDLAVTNPVSAYTTGTITINTNTVVQTVTINSTQRTTLIQLSVLLTGEDTVTSLVLKRGTATIFGPIGVYASRDDSGDATNVPISYSVIDTPTLSGNTDYSIEMTRGNGNPQTVAYRSLVVTELKK